MPVISNDLYFFSFSSSTKKYTPAFPLGPINNYA
jgi:hypothetical protein